MEPCALVVCNEKDLATFMRLALQSAGLSVQVAHTAPTAWDGIRVYKPDVIIVDMMLPRIGGIALLQMLRNNPTTRELPVILTTARTSSASRLEALEAGASAFLSRPFAERDLLRLVHEFLPLQSRHAAS